MMAAILCLGVLFTSKKSIRKLAGGKKPFSLVLCFMLFCSVIFLSSAISQVKADSVFPYSSARTYGALNGTQGWGPPNYFGSPPQSVEEQAAAHWVEDQMYDDFAASGYQVFNCVEGQTTVANEGTNAYSDSLTYDRCTVFHYGHMNGPINM